MRKRYPVSIACEVLEVSASGYFIWARQYKIKSQEHEPARVLQRRGVAAPFSTFVIAQVT